MAKVCSSRPSRQFPERYSKRELMERIRTKNPYLNRAELLRLSFKALCRLAGLPLVEPIALEKTEAEKNRALLAAERARDAVRYFAAAGGVAQHKQLRVKEEKDERADCLHRGRKRLFEYQERVVRHFDTHRGLIAVHSVGSGKTLTAVCASQCYLDRHPTGTVLVICPTSLVENFKKEMIEFGDGLRHADRYEFFSIQGFYARYRQRCRDCRNTMLIVDEAHNLRTEYKKGKKRSVGIYGHLITKCAERANRVLLLTATPLINRPTDIVPLLNMIRDHPTTHNKIIVKQFAASMLNPEYMRQVARCRFSFYERDRASDDYPSTSEENIYLTMPPRFLQTYRKIEDAIENDDEVLRTFGQKDLKAFYNGIRRAVNILSELPEDQLLKSPKVRWILSRFADPKHAPRTVIFSHFLDHGLEAIRSRLPSYIRSAFITGSQPRGRRAEIVRAYNRGDLDVLFLSKAGGEGIDLKGTQQLILMESGWNQNSEKQVIGRAVRYQSHTHLPIDKRHVKIFRLLHVKPSETGRIEELMDPERTLIDFKDPITWISADLMLQRIMRLKEDKITQFLHRLHPLSIEANPDC